MKLNWYELKIAYLKTENNDMQVKIYANDTEIVKARKIYNHFILHQSCNIEGFSDRTDISEPLGRVVWQFMVEMDYEENYICEPGRKPRRKYRNPPVGSIGGAYAHKIFRRKEELRDGQLVTIIWRVQ